MAAIVLCLLASWAGAAQAESADGVPWLARYDAPAGCPAQAELERGISARASQQALRAGSRLAVRIARDGERMRGTIAFRSGAEERSIEAGSCSELVEALALIAALMLEPTRSTEKPPAPLAVAPAPHARSRDRADLSERESEVAPVDGPSAPVPAIAAAATARAAVAVQPNPQTEPWQHQLALLASGLWMRGVAPAAHAGFGASAEYRLLARRAALLARGGVRSLLGETLRREQGDVTFRWWSYAGTLCAERAIGTLSFAACGALELGRLTAQGSDTLNPRQASRPWFALGPALLVRWQIVRPIFLQLGAELLLPLSHHRYVLADNTVHLVPWLTFRGELSLGVRIW